MQTTQGSIYTTLSNPYLHGPRSSAMLAYHILKTFYLKLIGPIKFLHGCNICLLKDNRIHNGADRLQRDKLVLDNRNVHEFDTIRQKCHGKKVLVHCFSFLIHR